MKIAVSIASLPNAPAVYALMGGPKRGRYVAYVGIAGKLRQRIIQHLVLRDSSVTTGTSAACLNPDYVTEVRWWENKSFSKKASRQAAELVALEVLNPALRSRGRRSTAARKVHSDPEFRTRMESVFSGRPTGALEVQSLQSLAERVERLEQSLDELATALRRS